jgi:hypothetical protein
MFKNACPTAVTYAFDDSSSNFICPSGSEEVGPDYEIGFGDVGASPNSSAVFAVPSARNLRVTLAAGSLEYSHADGADLRVALYDAGGRTLLDRKLRASSGSFAVPALPAGAYAVAVYTGNRVLQTRSLHSVGALLPAGR